MFPIPLSACGIIGLVVLLAAPCLLLAVVSRVPALRGTEAWADDGEPRLTRSGGALLVAGGAGATWAGVAVSGPHLAAAPFGVAVAICGAAAFFRDLTMARRVRHAGLAILVVAGLLLPVLLDL